MSKLYKNIYIATLVAQGVTIDLIENVIPYPLAFVPGTKLGLVNLITVIAIFTTRKCDSFSPVCLRLILATLLDGTLSTSFCSASGALLSYFGTLLIKQLGPRRVGIIGTSAVGDFLHSVGQLLAISFFAHSWAPMLYLLFLSLFGLPLGTVIEIVASYLLQHV